MKVLKMKYVIKGLLFFILTNVSWGANILVFLGTNLPSHLLAVGSFLEHISPQHNITFYVAGGLKYKNPNVIIRHVFAPTILHNVNQTLLLKNACKIDAYNIFYNHILHGNESYFNAAYSDNNVQKLLASEEKYDLLILCGYGTQHFFPMAHRFDTPVIEISPSTLWPWFGESVNSPMFWDTDLSFMISKNSETFFGRLNRFVKNALIWHRYYQHFVPQANKAINRHFPPGTPGLNDLMKRIGLIFINTHYSMGFNQPLTPAVVQIGGMHIKPSKPLPLDLEEFISGSGEHGFIYFSLGTVVQESTLPENKRLAMLNVFRKIPQRVLWKWNGEMKDVPSNVMISKWFPQNDILSHKQIKLFITQGGILSVHEAGYFGVPMLVMPVLFDQYTNAYVAEKMGYGKSLDFCRFTDQLFHTYIKELLDDPKYDEKIKQISVILRNEVRNVTNKINFWIDYVIKHRDMSNLRPVRSRHTWAQTPADIFFVLISFIAFVLLFMYYTFIFTWRLILKIKLKNKVKIT